MTYAYENQHRTATYMWCARTTAYT